ncbi:MAG: hypothetical protein HQK83_13340 [Fibrobacteria bacterium]|nr:hypothetical protein [Fibrobacteria bacterium]
MEQMVAKRDVKTKLSKNNMLSSDNILSLNQDKGKKHISRPSEKIKESLVRKTTAEHYTSTIGRVVLCFSDLEDEVSNGIIKCLSLKKEVGNILMNELPFNLKVNILNSLVLHYASNYNFNTGKYNQIKVWDMIKKHCLKAEEKKNQLIHSNRPRMCLTNSKTKNLKTTQSTKVKNGMMDATNMIGDAKYMLAAGVYVRDFFAGISKKK